MVDFAKLRKNKTSNLAKLAKAAESVSNNNRATDADQYWKCELDKSKNGYAVIRFLPVSSHDIDNPDALPWVKFYDHGWENKTNGQWYIEKSLTSIGQSDPVYEYNNILYNSGSEADKEQAKLQKRRLHYVSNILVIKDSTRPENNGKVFKYIYGKKIFEKITAAMSPAFEDESPIDPFCLDEGANFKLKVKYVDGYINYDSSEFDKPSAVSDDDSKLEEIWKSEYSLLEILDPKNFKTFDELKSRLDRVTGNSVPKYKSAEDHTKKTVVDDDDIEFIKESTKVTKAKVAVPLEDDESDADLSYFESLLDD